MKFDITQVEAVLATVLFAVFMVRVTFGHRR